MAPFAQVSTGINGLDEILNYLQMGDNVVFQVDNIEDYKKICRSLRRDGSGPQSASCLYALCQPSRPAFGKPQH